MINTIQKRAYLKSATLLKPLMLLGVMFGVLVAVPASAALTLDEMLAKIRDQSVAVNNQNREREASFQAALQAEERRAADALAQRNAAEELGNQLSARYDENEVLIRDMNVLLELHQGNLGELFGVTRQIAGDAAGVLGSSLITTQFLASEGGEDRVDFMRRIAAATALPSLLELERVWVELMTEMTEDSKVVRYVTPVKQVDGTVLPTEVVRVGSFTAVSDEGYLTYIPSAKALEVMPRQPADSEIMAASRELMEAQPGSGHIPAVVDPARGGLLSLVVERPDIFERIAEGEVVGYIIIMVGLLGAALALFQYVYLIIARISVNRQVRHIDQPAPTNALGRVLLAVSGKEHAEDELPEILELRISEASLREVMRLERFQSFLRLAVAAGPLLGLIGTVIGMIITFESITASGSSDPKLMAQGIGQAMIATVLGLGIAIPLLFINSGLAALSRSVIRVLEEQGTHLMTMRLEQNGK